MMREPESSILRLYTFLSTRDLEKYRRTIEEAKRIGDVTPEMYGVDVSPSDQSNSAELIRFRIQICIDVLEIAMREFDELEKNIKKRIWNHRRLKMFSSFIGALSSSSLVAMISANNFGSDGVKLFSATLALLSSLVIIFAENSWSYSSGFWEKISTASSLRGRSNLLLRKLKAVSHNSPFLPDLDTELKEAEKIATELDSLLKEIERDQLREGDRK